MSDNTPLNSEQHGHLRETPDLDLRRYREHHFVPIVLQDFYTLATEFVLPFVRAGETGEFVPVAMMGLNKGSNLYCQEDRWPVHVVPIGFTLDPLAVTRFDPETNEAVIAIDESSPRLSHSEGEALYDADGNQTAYLQRRIERLIDVARQSLQTQSLCRYLAAHKLFKQQPITLQHRDDGPRYEIEGVYTIDEERMRQLSGDEFQELRMRGLLPIIYSHLTSLQQLNRLSGLQYRADKAASQSAAG